MFTANKLLVAAMLVAGATAGGAATAATVYDFVTASPAFYSAPLRIGPFTVTARAEGLGNNGADLLTQSSFGLGVRGEGLIDPGLAIDQFRIDGKPAGSSESVTLTFDYAVRLDSFTLSDFDGNDDYAFAINSGPAVSSALAVNALAANYVTSFTLFASGVVAQDGLLGNDEFGLQSIQVSPVPVPATLGLLGAALAGLGLVRRWRRPA